MGNLQGGYFRPRKWLNVAVGIGRVRTLVKRENIIFLMHWLRVADCFEQTRSIDKLRQLVAVEMDVLWKALWISK